MPRRWLPLLIAMFVAAAPAAGELCAIQCVEHAREGVAAGAEGECHHHAVDVDQATARVSGGSHACGHDGDGDVAQTVGINRNAALHLGLAVLDQQTRVDGIAFVAAFGVSAEPPRAGPLSLRSAIPLRI